MLLMTAPMAYEIGQWTGRIAAVLFTTAGLLKCYSILRRPTANTKCLLSLMLVLGTLLISSVLGIAGALLPGGGGYLRLLRSIGERYAFRLHSPGFS